MAQESEQLIDLLLEMKRSCDSNMLSFDNLLNRITTKLDFVDNKSSIELLRTYIKELTTSLEDKYKVTQKKFTDIEKALKVVYKLQGEQIKNSEIKELFDIFSKNVNNFSVETKQNKAVLTSIEAKLTDLFNNKTDKEDILRTISLLRNDIENVNNVYKHTIDDININLKSIINGMIKLDPLKSNEAVKEQIDVIFKAINTIVNQLQEVDKRHATLENILSQVATGEDLKITRGIIDKIIDKTNNLEEIINNLTEKTSGIKKKMISKENFADLIKQIEDVLNSAHEIKNSLGQMSGDLEQKANTQTIENSLKSIYSKIDILTENISAANVKGDVFDLSTRLNSIKDELSTIKNIVIDLNDALSTKVVDAIEALSSKNKNKDIKNSISEMLKEFPTKDYIDKILQENNDVLKELVNKTSYLSDNFEKEFSCIYDKTSSIENWLESSNIKENSEKIARSIEEHTKKSNMSLLNSQIEGIVKNLEDLSQSRDIGKVGNNISDIAGKIDNLIKLVKNIKKDDSDKILSKLTDIETKISKMASIEDFGAFINEVKQCIIHISSHNNNAGDETNNIEENQNNISERLNSLDFSVVNKILETKFEELVIKINAISENNQQLNILSKDINEKMEDISQYVKSNLPIDITQLENQLTQIKNIIETKILEHNGYIGDVEPNSISVIEQYLKEISDYTKDKSESNLDEKISKIETLISNYKEYSENAFLQILNKVENVGNSALNSYNSDNNINIYLDELSELKDQILDLGYTIKEADYKQGLELSDKQEEFIKQLNKILSEKISNIGNSFDNLTDESGQNLNENYNYYSELIETKTSEIIKFIKETQNVNIDNSSFVSTLEDASTKLADFKEEFKLVSTDITETVNVQATKLIEEINPIKEILLNQSANNDFSELKNQIAEVHNELISNKELSSNTDKLETLYSKITEKLSQSENSLKDFILSDTDSIILKLDNIKDFVEKALKGYVPVDNDEIENSQDMSDFKKDLNDFKQEQKEILENILELVNATGLEQQNLASLIQDGFYKQEELTSLVKENLEQQNDINSLIEENTNSQQELTTLVKSSIENYNGIQTSIDSNFKEQEDNFIQKNEELKSLIAVAMNHDDIIIAIDDLRDEFEQKLLALDEISNSLEQNNQNNTDIEVIVEDLKDTFAKYSNRIDSLSMQNGDIETVLETINNKIDDLIDINNPVDITEEPDKAEKENDKFDFIHAFDILQQDITDLRDTIKKSITINIPNSDGKEIQYNPGDISTLNAKVDVVMQSLDSKDSMLDSLNYRIDELIGNLGNGENNYSANSQNAENVLKSANKTWLNDIKNYIEDSQINSMLKSINEKLDILATTDGNEILEDISYDVDSEIIPAVKNLSESDKKITAMLETLNEKINNVLTSDSNIGTHNIDDIKTLILEQKDYINKMEPNDGIDAFKKCLDELSTKVNELNSNTNSSNQQLKTSLHDMKESIMTAVVAIFDQVSFVEESEDIKDFVEERTNEINKNIENITKQLQQITTSNEDNYTYSMQDIETDLSKLRMALKEIQTGSGADMSEELSQITDKIKEVAASVDNMSQDEIKELKSEVSSLKEQTQFLIATSDKSYNALNSGLDDFEEIIQDNLTGKVDTITKMLEKSEASDNVIKQALIYMGEWIDSTSVSIDKIQNNSQDIEKITEILDKFENVDTKLKKIDKQIAQFETLEEQFVKQDERIDRLEKNIEKVLSAIENLEDNALNRKIEKIEKQITKLNTNIEKLTSYVED